MSEKRLYAVALFALKVPPDCPFQERAGGVVFGGAPARQAHFNVETFLRAAYACAASPQEAEAGYLELLRRDLPARDGWTCHSAKVEALPDIEEMVARLDLGDALAPEVGADGEEYLPELLM